MNLTEKIGGSVKQADIEQGAMKRGVAWLLLDLLDAPNLSID